MTPLSVGWDMYYPSLSSLYRAQIGALHSSHVKPQPPLAAKQMIKLTSEQFSVTPSGGAVLSQMFESLALDPDLESSSLDLKCLSLDPSGALPVENFQENPRVTQIQQSHSAKRVCIYSAG